MPKALATNHVSHATIGDVEQDGAAVPINELRKTLGVCRCYNVEGAWCIFDVGLRGCVERSTRRDTDLSLHVVITGSPAVAPGACRLPIMDLHAQKVSVVRVWNGGVCVRHISEN